MKDIEYTTIDKSGWPRGPWDDEIDKRQWVDPASGLPCMILRARKELGHWCGYVGVPPTHPLHGKDYDSVDVDVHGGLTFAAGCSGGDPSTSICHVVEPGEPDDAWWFGFDCAHYMDLLPGISLSCGDETYRDQGYVTRETERLAKQLAALAAKQ